MQVRRATLEDAEEIMRIYNTEVTGSLVTFDMVARNLNEQRSWILSHQGAYPAIVALEAPRPNASNHLQPLAGFAALSPYRERPAYSTTVEDSVYVDKEWRGKGVGKLLLTELVKLATAHGFHSIIARTVRENESSIALHKSCGFEVVGTEIQVGRKFGRWLDVVVLQKLL
ncbi:MAG: N-acetyltransferase family protein [Actinobacteria bacterium]|nr:N-acetyltransferase family protein [Actinomycetota bacterium]